MTYGRGQSPGTPLNDQLSKLSLNTQCYYIKNYATGKIIHFDSGMAKC